MIISSHYSNTQVKVFRNVSTPLDFLVKDYDRQPVNAAGQLRFMIWTKPNLPPILERAVTTVDATKGHYRITITPEESAAMKLGHYSWSVIRTVSGVETMLFADRNYATDPTLLVVEGIPQALSVPIELDPADFTLSDGWYASSSLEPSGLLGGQHTAVYALTNFTGTIKVQGSLEEDIPTNEGWIDVEQKVFTASTQNYSHSFEGNFTWTRFLVNNITGLTEITYRN